MTNFDSADPSPPRFLYKYLSIERIDSVLGGGTVRFTPLMNTNDSFEVRSTYDQFAGSKMQELVLEQIDNTISVSSLHSIISDILKESGLEELPPELVLELVNQHYGRNIQDVLHTQLQDIVETSFLPTMNSPEFSKKMMEQMGRELLCLSLSERMDIAPMWAHYADNNAGFIVAFDTSHDWFRKLENGKKIGLQKVTYLDGLVNEPLDDPQAAFISKMTDWSYEREWRLFMKAEDADLIVGHQNDPIHLRKFPPDCVDRVIIGPKTDEAVANRIHQIMASHYPHADLVRAVPNPMSHLYDEIAL